MSTHLHRPLLLNKQVGQIDKLAPVNSKVTPTDDKLKIKPQGKLEYFDSWSPQWSHKYLKKKLDYFESRKQQSVINAELN